ncbi:MAG: hypothetical protein C5B58_15875, partial [Acidobacteria bacterium]
LMRNGVDDSNDVRLEEQCIKPGETLFVIGTLGEHTWPLSWDARPHVGAKRTTQIRLQGTSALMTIRHKPGADRKDWTVRVLGPNVDDSGDLEQVRQILGSPGGNSVHTSRVVNKFVVDRRRVTGQADPEPGVASLATLPDTVLEEISKATRGVIDREQLEKMFSEARNKQQTKDQAAGAEELPKIGIGKGRRGDPFIISWRSQKEVVAQLGRRAVLCILSGPLIAVVSLYLLLELLGQLAPGR